MSDLLSRTVLPPENLQTETPAMTTLKPKANFLPTLALHSAQAEIDAPVQPRTLIEAVQAVVRAVEEDTLRPVARPDPGLAYEPKALLALLTYCYARKAFGSE